MADWTYIAFVLAFAVLGSFLGVGVHFWRANATVFPEKLFDGDIANEIFMKNYLTEKYVVGAEWDDAGYWATDSLRNLMFYMTAGFATPLLIGAVLWPQRAQLVSSTCKALTDVGLTPLLC
jgi:hypothetical protein